jgi:hypothetical protein
VLQLLICHRLKHWKTLSRNRIHQQLKHWDKAKKITRIHQELTHSEEKKSLLTLQKSEQQ